MKTIDTKEMAVFSLKFLKWKYNITIFKILTYKIKNITNKISFSDLKLYISIIEVILYSFKKKKVD